MEHEVRSSDIFTMLANLMDPQSSGLQSSQINNNNSNQISSIHRNLSQVDQSKDQSGSNTNQTSTDCRVSSSIEISSTKSSAVNTAIDCVEKMSALSHPSFGISGNNMNATQAESQDKLYGSSSQVGAVSQISNTFDPRILQFSSSALDTGSQNQSIFMETLNNDTCVSEHDGSESSSYVSLLHQQSANTCNGRWPLISSIPAASSIRKLNENSGSSRQRNISSRNLIGNESHSFTNNFHQSSKVKMQHSSHHMHSNTEGISNIPSHLDSSHPEISENDAFTQSNSCGIQIVHEDMENRSKEKKLTTTPIPSDADKSSCSSTSSGSISGPEHSPDHVSDHRSVSSKTKINSLQVENQEKNSDRIHNLNQLDQNLLTNRHSRNYPCYGNMNVLNFGTINFSPVMDSTTSELENGIQVNDSSNIPDTTSGNFFIETPRTNSFAGISVPFSTHKPTDANGRLGSKNGYSDGGSYTQMQTVSALSQTTYGSLSETSRSSELLNSNNNLVGLNSTNNSDPSGRQLLGKNRDKQKKSKIAKRKVSSQLNFNNVHRQGLGQNGMFSNDYLGHSSGLKPKVNADPTGKSNFGSQSIQFNWLPQPGMTSTNLGMERSHIDSAKHSKNGIGEEVGKQSTLKKSRQWQTVTAVQGPKLPPMLSEQDRIPKRGRPSKKMMQQNLKVKKDGEAVKPPLSLANVQVPPAPETTQVQSVKSPTNLVSMYTINDKGLMEEIAPKVKENRRSKERTQAFLKFLDDIKSASKQQVMMNPKFAAKSKNNAEKQMKRKPRSRTKVFGRQVSQPLTESGITETMYTFSALAHQYKISSSIVERATENLLKSAALKRNKEQNSLAAVQQCIGDKNKRNSSKNVKNVKDDALVAASYTEVTKTMNSMMPSVITTVGTSDLSLKKINTYLGFGEARKSELQIVPSSKSVTESTPTHQQILEPNVSASLVPVHIDTQSIPENDIQKTMENDYTVSVTSATSENTETLPVSSKGKHKKKKHKKHKKHKHPDPSGKKKKRDKDKKKKMKKKLKSKPGYALSPSSSAPLVKPPTRPSNGSEPNKSVSAEPMQNQQENNSGTHVSMSVNNDTFSLNFRQIDRTENNNFNPWQQDNDHDADDSSSDEASVSPESSVDRSFTTSVSANALSSFAQYSTSRIGFGTFSAEKSVVRTDDQDKILTTPVIIPTVNDHSDTFTSQGHTHSSKKHSKHKKKKFFRKSKNICDPAFLLILDELVKGFENLALDPFQKRQQDHKAKNANIFFNVSFSDASRTRLEMFQHCAEDSSESRIAVFPKNAKSLKGLSKREGIRECNTDSTTQQMLHQKSKSDGKPDVIGVENESINLSNDANANLISLPTKPANTEQTNALSKSRGTPFKRKRGWPRGKPRGPRAKKSNSLSTSKIAKSIQQRRNLPNSELNTKRFSTILTDSSCADGDIDDCSAEEKNYQSDDSLKELTRESVTSVSSSSASNSAESLLRDKLVGESLMQQIRKAIEANLPSTVNKDALTKSVDAAVQSYLENVTTAHKKTGESDQIDIEKSTRNMTQAADDPTQESQISKSKTKMNVEKHPKKFWAYKHQDTEIPPNSEEIIEPVVKPKKRRPGRPRKQTLNAAADNTPSSNMRQPTTLSDKEHGASGQGKVPTTSATVIPRKQRKSAFRLHDKSVKPNVKKILARARNDVSKRSMLDSPTLSRHQVITREEALSSTRAICSLKGVKMKITKGYLNDTEPGLYLHTVEDDHIREIINLTVEMYMWDTYKQFEDACSEVEREMGFLEDCDMTKQKNFGLKKSIESVVAKLKDKQAQSIHCSPTFHQVHNTTSHDDTQQLRDENGENNGMNRYDYDHNSNKVEKNVTINKNMPIKRSRGRPKKMVDGDIPAKKFKSSNEHVGKHTSTVGKKMSFKEKKQLKNKHHKQQEIVKSNKKFEESNSKLLCGKPYLQAGLYSSTYKRNSKSSGTTPSNDASNSVAKLPPPYDAGQYLRSTLKDFQLPYETWLMYKLRKISNRHNPSISFVKISKNIYTSPQPTPNNISDEVCSCNPNVRDACGRDCLNRLRKLECQPSTCLCGSSCTNRAIQQGLWCSSLERIKTDDRGWGICTNEHINKGSFILEYVGEVLSEAEFCIRTIELYHAYNDHFCIKLDSSTVIDGYRMANEGRFINHSCDPNCEMQKWCVQGESRIGIFALRHIQPGEELTFDYNIYAYDMNIQQVCRCGSVNCCGFIGGMGQRSSTSECNNNNDDEVATHSQSSDNLKFAKSNTKRNKGTSKSSKDDDLGTKEFSILQMKPISKQDKELIRGRQLFLLRNLTQVRKKEEEQNIKVSKDGSDESSTPSSSLSAKTVSKSRPKKSQHSKKDSKKIEAALTEMYTAIATCKDQNGVSVAIPFMNLPSKKKNPEYYERISDPIDLSVIERNIMSNHYKDIETFNSDVQRVFKNAEKYHGRKSTLGKDVSRLRKAYANARGAAMLLLNGHKKVTNSSDSSSEEDIDEHDEHIHRKNEDHIRCICCIYKDEGLMVQCEKCYVWQHCDCMGVKPGSTDRYLCEECDPRPYSREVQVIPTPPNTPPGHTYYITLLRDSLLIKQGDCVYLMRDHRLRQNNSNALSMRASNRKLANIPQDKLDIFRIEQLWTDERGDKYAYGHHFLRPHETHHSPSRTFYHNELFVSPFSEIIPLEAIVGLCCVMDLYTYCKGKPKDFKISDIFICDFRVDKAAGLFTRITKKRYPICTKPHVFDMYRHKICPKKNFQPHQVPEQYKKSSGRPSVSAETSNEENFHDETDCETELCNESVGSPTWKKRQRLNRIAQKLLSKLPKQADVSYLLDPGSGKRQRKKTKLSLESISQQK